MAYSSFGPISFRELDWKRANECPTLFEHNVITTIAKAHKRTAAEVLLRWSTQQGVIVIPKATDPVLVRQNLDHIHFDLTKEEIQAITNLDVGMRFNNPADVCHRSFFPRFESVLTFTCFPHSTSRSTSCFTCSHKALCHETIIKMYLGCITSVTRFHLIIWRL